MPFSDDIELLLDVLDQASGTGLNKRNDIGTLLDLAAERGADVEMNDLIFHGRVLDNLYRTLRKARAGSEGYPRLEHEFAQAVETLRERMARVLVTADAQQIERFELHYYAATQGGLRNLVDLAHDLGVLKALQNERRYGDAAADDTGTDDTGTDDAGDAPPAGPEAAD